MTIIRLPRLLRLDEFPLIVFIDLQNEYITEGRAHYIKDIDECLENCRRLLDAARTHNLPIAHFRQTRQSQHFNKQTAFADWIDGFRPRANEMVFERELPSCYSSEAYCAFLNNLCEPRVALAGLTGETACLSTAIDGFHRSHKINYVFDCSMTPAFTNLPEHAAHEFVSEIISLYAAIISLNELTEALERLKQLPKRSYRIQ